MTWLCAGTGRRRSSRRPPPIPATVAKPLKEDQLNHHHAHRRSGRAAGSCKPARSSGSRCGRLRVYGGEVTIPAGQAIVVSAPLSGMLKPPGGGVPQPGQRVNKGQPSSSFLPLLTPEGRANLAAKIDADGQVKSAQTQLDAARIALDRAKQLLKARPAAAGPWTRPRPSSTWRRRPSRPPRPAATCLKGRRRGRDAARRRRSPIESPEAGLLRNVSALAGPECAGRRGAVRGRRSEPGLGARAGLRRRSCRRIDASADATVGNFAAAHRRPGSATRRPSRRPRPPSANPATGTVDLVLRARQPRQPTISPGQRVGGDAAARTAKPRA